MEEDLYHHIEIPLTCPNDRYNLLLLKYLKKRSKKQEIRYGELCLTYPENDYFEIELVKKLLELGLMRKEMTKEQVQTASGYVKPGEFNPITTVRGRQALSGLFPSEIEERKRMLHQYKINKGAFWIAVIGGIGGFITTIINLYIQFC